MRCGPLGKGTSPPITVNEVKHVSIRILMAISTQTKVRPTAVARVAAMKATGLVRSAPALRGAPHSDVVGRPAVAAPPVRGAARVAAPTVVGRTPAAGSADATPVVPGPVATKAPPVSGTAPPTGHPAAPLLLAPPPGPTVAHGLAVGAEPPSVRPRFAAADAPPLAAAGRRPLRKASGVPAPPHPAAPARAREDGDKVGL